MADKSYKDFLNTTTANTTADAYDAQFAPQKVDQKKYKKYLSQELGQFSAAIPAQENVGGQFEPYGGLKPIDNKLTEADLQDIPEARAQAQSGFKLIGNAIGQTASELTLGTLQGVGYLFQDDIFEGDKGEADFENAWTEAFGKAKDSVAENWFPIYQTRVSEQGTFAQKLGDGTWWANNFPTVASTASMLIPGLAAAKGVSLAGKLGKEARVFGKMAKGLSQVEAVAADAKAIGAAQSLAGAVTSRYVENAMEASERFKTSYETYLNQGLTDDKAKLKAGEEAARTWKYNSAMIAIDVLQFGALLKPFKAFGEAAEVTKKSMAQRALNPIIQAGGEGVEESYQFISQEEATQDKPFDTEFLNKRFGDYLKNPDLQTSAFWGAVGGGTMQTLNGVAQKVSGVMNNYSAKKIRAAAFGDVQSYKDLSQDMFNNVLSRHYQSDNLDKLEQDLNAFSAQHQSKEGVTEEDKQEIQDRTNDYMEQLSFVKNLDNTLQQDPKFKDTPNARKNFALLQLEAKVLAEDINTASSNVEEFYRDAASNTSYRDAAPVNKELNKLEALKTLKNAISKKDNPNKENLVKEINSRIESQQQVVNDAIANYKEVTKQNSYKKVVLPNEDFIKNEQIQLELRQLKHDFEIQTELAKYSSAGKSKIKEEETNIQQSQKKAAAEAAKEVVNTADNPEEIKQAAKDSTPEEKSAVNTAINNRAKEETSPVINAPNTYEKTVLQKAAEKVNNNKPLDTVELVTVEKYPEDFGKILTGIKQPSNKIQTAYTEAPATFSKDKEKLVNHLQETLLDKVEPELAMQVIDSIESATNPQQLDAIIDQASEANPVIEEIFDEFYEKVNKAAEPKVTKLIQQGIKQLENIQATHIIAEGEQVGNKPISTEVVVETVDIEAKKAEIERGRQEELGSRESRKYTLDDGTTNEVILTEEKEKKVVRVRKYDSDGNLMGQFESVYKKELSNEEIYELYNADEYEYSEIEQLTVEGKKAEATNAKYDSKYVDAVKKGEMTKEQAMKALEKVGRKNSAAYAELAALEQTHQTTPPSKGKVLNQVVNSHKKIKGKFEDTLTPWAQGLKLGGIDLNARANLKIGDALTTLYDPNDMVKRDDDPAKVNSSLSDTYKRVWLLHNGVKVGELYDAKQAPISNEIKQRVLNGEQVTLEVNSTWFEKDFAKLDTPVGDLRAIMTNSTPGNNLINLAYVAGDKYNKYINPSQYNYLKVPPTTGLGQIGFLMPRSSETTQFYSMTTKALETNKEDLNKVIDLLKGVDFIDGSTEAHENATKINEFIPISIIKGKDSVTGNILYSFIVDSITPAMSEKLSTPKNPNNPKQNAIKITRLTGAYEGKINVLVSDNIIQNLQPHQEGDLFFSQLKDGDLTDPRLVNEALLDWLGSMNYTLSSETLEKANARNLDAIDLIASRTTTNLHSMPLRNPNFSFVEVSNAVTTPVSESVQNASENTSFIADVEPEVKPQDVVEQVIENNQAIVENDFTETIEGQLSGLEDFVGDIEGLDISDLTDIEIFSKGIDNEIYKPWNEKEELAWLSKNLPNFAGNKLQWMELKQTLKGVPIHAYGKFKNGVIYLSKDAKEGTAQHEAFHAVFWTALNKSQRNTLIKEGAVKYGISDPELIEEAMADDFNTYRKYEDSSSLPAKIKAFFNRILGWIKSEIFNTPTIDYIYYKLNNGKFKNLEPDANIKIERLSSRFFGTNLYEAADVLNESLMKMVNAMLANPKNTTLQGLSARDYLLLVDEEGKTNLDKFYGIATMYLISKLKDFKNAGADVTKVTALENLIKEATVAKVGSNELLYGSVGILAKTKLTKLYGLSATSTRVYETDDVEYTLDNNDEEEVKGELYSSTVKEQSGQMGLSAEMRLALSTIPTKDKDFLDLFPKRLQFDFAYAYLKHNLSDIPTKELMLDKLEELSKAVPDLKNFYNKVMADESLKSKLFVDFYKSTTPFMTVFQRKDGSIGVESSINTMADGLVSDWESNFYDNGWIEDSIVTDTARQKAKEFVANNKIQDAGYNEKFNTEFQLNLNPDTISSLESRYLGFIASNLVDKINPFEKSKSVFRTIAKAESIYNMDSLESSFRRSDGKTIYGHLIPGFASKQIARLKHQFNETMAMYEGDAFYRNSPLFQDLKANTNNIREELAFGLISEIRMKGIKEGDVYVDFSDKQYLSFLVGAFQNNNSKTYAWYPAPVLSDSSEGMLFKLPKYADNNEVLDKLVQVVKQEYARINETTNVPEIKNYSKNKKKLHFIPLNLSDITKDGELVSNDKIKAKISEYLDNRFELYFAEIEKNELFNPKDLQVDSTFLQISKYVEKVSPELKARIKEKFRNQFLNSTYAQTQIITMTTGDPAMYKAVTDFYKRSKEIISPTIQMDFKATYNNGTEVITPGVNYNTLYVKDHEIAGNIAKDFWDYYQETGDISYAKLAAQYGYSNHTVTNKDGKKTDFVKIELGDSTQLFKTQLVNTADAQTFISPERYRKIMVGYQRWNKQFESTYNRIVNEQPLLPEDYDVTFQALKPFVFSHIKHISGKVIPTQNKNSEYMLTPQLIKASPTLKKMYDLMRDKKVDSISFTSVVKVGEYNAVSLQDILNGNIKPENIHSLKNADYGLQQETPEHHVDSEALFGSQIRKLILSNLDFEQMYNVEGQLISGKELYDEYHRLISKNIEESWDGVLEEIGDTVDGKFKISMSKLSGLLLGEVIKQGYGKDVETAVSLNADGRLNVHPSDPIIRDTVEKLLNAVFKNRITKQKIKGGSFIQTSGVGFSSDLKIVMGKDSNGNPHIKEVECYLPWSSRKYFEPFMDAAGEIDIKQVPESLLKMIGYRIPTEDKYSMLPLKVKGFLPFQAGGSIMLPIEITTLAGSDFDVDKLYVMMPEFGTDKEKNRIYKIKNQDRVEGRNNRIIDLMYGVLTNSSTFKAAITPGGIGTFQTAANLVYLSKNGQDFNQLQSDLESGKISEEDLQEMVENKLAQEESIGFSDPYSNMKVFRRNMSGKALVGIMANHSVAHAMLQFTNVELATPVIIGGQTYTKLNQTRDKNGNYISFGSWVAAATDNAKDPNAYKVNINTYTADVASLLNHLGVPIEEAFMLLSQPIVVELAERYFRNGATFDAEKKAIKELTEIVEKTGDKTTTTSVEDMIKGFDKGISGNTQLKMLTTFLQLKEQAQSLARFIAATKPDTKGIGPNSVNNELSIRAIRETLADEKLLNTEGVFKGDDYPMFKAFITYGLVKPTQLMEQILPLSNTNKNSIVDQIKVKLQASINKSKLNEKDLRKVNDTILSYLGQQIDFFKGDNNVKTFPETFKKLVTKELRNKFSILKHVEYRKDAKFEYPRLEFKNLGGVTKVLKEDIKASWESMYKDSDPKIRQFALDLARYTFYKEGFIFGPKSFAHLIPVDLMLTYKDGDATAREQWYNILESNDITLREGDIDKIIDIFITNNWKNRAYAPAVAADKNIIVDGKNGIPGMVTANADSQLKKGNNFMRYISVPFNSGKDSVLMKLDRVNYGDNGFAYSAVYAPVPKKGSGGVLFEMQEGLSILKENNKFLSLPEKNKVVNSVQKVARNLEVPSTLESQNPFETKEKEVLKTKINFTPDQQVAFTAISEYLKSNKRVPFTLVGKAGTGKTTLIKAIIDETPKNKKIAIAALSHKAKNVVYNGIATTKGLPDNVTVDTLAGILRMSMDPETGEFSQSFNEEFVFKNVPIESADIVIIDESSMVNEEAMALIINDGPSKIIFMGDKGQLPPIRSINSYLEIARTEGKDYQKITQLADLYTKSTNRKEKANLYAKVEEIAAVNGWNDYDSLTFNFADRAELVTRVRQGEESPILPYADNYWNNSDKENSVLDPVNKDTRVSNISDKGNLIFTDKKTAINKSIKEFEKSIETLNPNLVKIVSYRNETRKNINKYVHDELFGENSLEFNKGEILMFFDSYKVSEDISFQNSDEIQVEKSIPSKIYTVIKNKVFDGYILSTTVEVGAKKELVDIQVLTQESKKEFDLYISELFNEAGKMPKGKARSEFYRRIYAEKNKIANLDYAYAITSHKSQGSTYNTVMILEDDIMSVAFSTQKAKSQAMYTAITRAKNNVMVVSGKNTENLKDFNIIEDKPVTLESQQNTLSLSKTKQDIIDNLELYSSQLEGITREDIINADANKLGEILKKICK